MVGGIVFAVRFDPRRLETVGTAVSILDGVLRAPVGATAASQFAFSSNGLLRTSPALQLALRIATTLPWQTGRGESSPLKLPLGLYESPRVSRDGKRIAFGGEDASGSFILVHDLYGKTAPRRITFKGRNRLPICTADGNRSSFSRTVRRPRSLLADGGWQRRGRTVTNRAGVEHIPDDCSPERPVSSPWPGRPTRCGRCRFVIERSLRVAVASSVPSGARFSRDGRWIAYGMRDGSRHHRGRTVSTDRCTVQLLQKPGSSAPSTVVSRRQ